MNSIVQKVIRDSRRLLIWKTDIAIQIKNQEYLVQTLWNLACEYEGLPQWPGPPLPNFWIPLDNSNPYKIRFERVREELAELNAIRRWSQNHD